uniref:Helix-turn-helix DNA binding domain protein n=1 Tax=Streptomyces phage Scarif TaxID=3158858 RepID=A0AAU7GZV5_9CAUD
MSGISQQRELIKQAYPHSKTWSSKVDKMPEGQVQAIFLRMRREGKV